MEVKLSGLMFFQASFLDEDLSSGYGRGHTFRVPETEIHFNASNTADNGIKYGVSIELESNEDAESATINGDEVWAFISGDFGRIELGDQDDVTNRMFIHAGQTNQGFAGAAGGLLGLNSMFHKGLGENFLVRSDWQPFTTGDKTKIIYFTPRFSGFQGGVSYTPDTGQLGASTAERDDDGDYSVVSLGLNYVGKFDNVGFSASITYEGGENEIEQTEDLEFLGIGAKIDFGGFSVAANYHDANDSFKTTAQTATGTDAGEYMAVGVGYKQGPWGVSGWYSVGERDEGPVEIEVTRWGIGAGYAVAPGWKVGVDYMENEHDNRGGNSGLSDKARGVSFTNFFSF
jgi:predicted porin